MTPHGIVARATFADAHELAAKLRPEDRREVEEITGKPALHNLLLAVAIGEPALTLRDHERGLIGIMGVARTGLHSGAVSFLGTSLIEQRSSAFLRGSREVLREVSKEYDTLFNVCDARNLVHQKWLKWLGFRFIRKIDRFGASGVPVIEFARITT